jgi:putative addiction module component (TIGR02574 family)
MDSAILANEALKLPALERAQMIDALWRSFDPVEQDSVDRAWLRESQDRLAAFHAGQLALINPEGIEAFSPALRGTSYAG